jgi:uncharacterized protein (TIGR00369 family)
MMRGNPMDIQPTYSPKHPEFETKVRSSFAKQAAMAELGITMTKVGPGFVELSMPYSKRFTQQHGFMHAGIISTALDSACGYAGLSLMPEDAAVLTVEFKTNLLAPASGTDFVFLGQVVKAGRTLSVCDAKAFSFDGSERKLIATMSGTLMAIYGRDHIRN